MQLKLEELPYQQQAITSVIRIFEGQERNTFDNATDEGIRFNYLRLSPEHLADNTRAVAESNDISAENLKPHAEPDFCIEMETGTGKTLVYLKTIFELYKEYGFAKFIILVPSVAIREGVLTSFATFADQLEAVYGFRPDCFEYDSTRLHKVSTFIEAQHPQIMVMTLQSFNSEDRILNQAQREDLFANLPFIEALGRTRPIIIMDEPQEGMDTPNAVARIAKLTPLCKLRYSATHKIMRNLIYRLTPFDSYRQGLVKKIEVLSVAEKNDEATLKIEVEEVRTFKDGREPQVKLLAWRYSTTKNAYEYKATPWLKVGDDLEEKSANVSYRGFRISRIGKGLRDRNFKVHFSNGTELVEKERSRDFAGIFGEQLHWLIDTHFRKREKLRTKGIKCLSLVFIDRVDNYVREDGLIRTLFIEKYSQLHKEHCGRLPTNEEITAVQGYYFSQTGKGEYTDNERSMAGNKELFDLILRDKEKLLALDNPVEFIFSHSALGVGWDNPNIFNIATLNNSYSEIKKRQEIGRGLRICVNRHGERVYDPAEVDEEDEVNLLTVIPNESYETFVTQYQQEIVDIYGTAAAGAETRHKHKGQDRSRKTLKRNEEHFNSPAFREFWRRLSRRTDYVVAFDEDALIERSAEALNTITTREYAAEITLDRITGLEEDGVQRERIGSETARLKARFAPLDLVEELSENTALAYPTVFKIVSKLTNFDALVRNPPLFLQEATIAIRRIELDEMLRKLTYTPNGESFPMAEFEAQLVRHSDRIQPTPQRGLYDGIVFDSDIEKAFAATADGDPEVVCFLKLPAFYSIATPIGPYNPDFGVVLKKGGIRGEKDDFYFVIETKGTNDLGDTKALTDSEIYKIKCAIRHFEALGVEARVNYHAPIKDYRIFKQHAEETINA